MPIANSVEPKGGRAIVNAAMAARLNSHPHLFAAGGEAPQTGAPLPVYTLSRDEALGPNALSAAQLSGWRYPIVGSQTALATLSSEPAHGLTFAGITNGIIPQRLLDGASLAEISLAESPIRYQARILEVPALHILCLWLVGPPDKFVSLLSGDPPGTGPLVLSDDYGAIVAAARSSASPAPPPGPSPTN